jgi:hypothetical protein
MTKKRKRRVISAIRSIRLRQMSAHLVVLLGEVSREHILMLEQKKTSVKLSYELK